MKYLVIWFILMNAEGYLDGTTIWRYCPSSLIEQKINKDTIHRVYKNYEIFDDFEKAKKKAIDVLQSNFLGQVKVYIYELGREYEVIPVEYKSMELREVSKTVVEIKEKP